MHREAGEVLPLGCSGTVLFSLFDIRSAVVGSFRMSVRKTDVNEKKEVVCGVTVLL